MITNPLPKAVSASLATWHRMISTGDLAALPSILHPQATFRSPMRFKPYHSAQAVALILTTVFGVFEDFTYHRELYSEDGLNVLLEFSATVDGKQIKGIDLVRFDADGLIVDFEVMVRPFNGLQALGDAMGSRIGPLLAAFKGNDGA